MVGGDGVATLFGFLRFFGVFGGLFLLIGGIFRHKLARFAICGLWHVGGGENGSKCRS